MNYVLKTERLNPERELAFTEGDLLLEYQGLKSVLIDGPCNSYLSLVTISFCSSNSIFLILNPNKEQIACLSLLSN